MKKYIVFASLACLAMSILDACKKDTRSLDLTVAPVTSLTMPASQASYALAPTSGPDVVFEWTPSTSKDLVLYEVVFDKPSGDFSKPVYKVLSDGNGVQAQATLTQKLLNSIASQAGIASLSTGTLKWSVLVSKATNSRLSAASNTIQLNRPAGFANIPDSLFLSGSASEQGTNASTAIAFKNLGNGVFELYTSLQPGNYQFIDKRSGSANVYSVQNNVTVASGGSTAVSGAKAVYRLTIDLGNAAATISQIVSVGLWSAPDNKIWFTLPYIGSSQWELDNYPLVIPAQSYGNDSRYKYQFIVNSAAGVQTLEWYGSLNSDNPDPSTSSSASYFYMFPVDNSQYNYCFKIVPAYNNRNVNVNVNFSPNQAHYTNSIVAK